MQGTNERKYKKCTHYMWGPKKEKSMRIAHNILSKVFPDCKYIHCESMFPQFDSKFVHINRLGVNIAAERSTLHDNAIFYTFYL